MRGLFGNDGISTTGKSNHAPLLLLGLGVFFFLAPLLFGSGHSRHRNLPVESGPTFGQLAPDSSYGAAHAATFVGPVQTVPWSETENEPDWSPSDPFVAKLKSIGGMLALVCVLVVFSLKLMQRRLPQFAARGSKAGPVLKVVARQGLTASVQLVVVQVGSKNLVLSVSDHGAQTICEMTPEEISPVSSVAPGVIDGEGGTVAIQENVRPSASEVYGQIFKQYLGIFPKVGAPKR